MGGCCSSKYDGSDTLDTAFDVIIKQQISDNAVLLYYNTNCPQSRNIKSTLKTMGVAYEMFDISRMTDSNEIVKSLQRITRLHNAPWLFVNGTCIGGDAELEVAIESGTFQAALVQSNVNFHSPDDASTKVNADR